MVHSGSIELPAKGFTDIHDITGQVARIVSISGVANGIVTVFVPGSTGAITSIEFESGAISDLKEAIERLAPHNLQYSHDARWGDGNGFSHVRAALLGASFSVPVTDSTLGLGTWQQIVFIDLDNRNRTRTILVQVVGD